MKLFIYGLKDNVEGEFVFTFKCKNDGLMQRVVKGCLMDKNGNAFTNNIKDKSIYLLGEFETLTGQIASYSPVFLKELSEIRLDLIREIKIAKAESGEEKPEADEVVDDE